MIGWKAKSNKWLINAVLALICLVWLVPTVGLFVSSFRPPAELLKNGWWTIFPHKEWGTTQTIQLDKVDLKQPINVLGQTYSDQQLRDGIVRDDDSRLIWENRRKRTVSVQTQSWTMNLNFTFDNYVNVLGGKEYEITLPNGSTEIHKGDNMLKSFLNTFVVTIPSTVISILIASFAAYAFAWMKFKGRKTIFVMVIFMLVVPVQMALIPILRDYSELGLNGTYLGVWIAHTGFGLPLVTYFMYNYISQLPKEILESAYMDGASNFTIFTRLIMPLSVPALASIAIFQFLWIWNDYLVSLIFIGNQPDVQVLSMRIADLIGTRGSDWHLLTSAAFISMLMPLAVFFGLQRYFVKGLLGGSVKG